MLLFSSLLCALIIVASAQARIADVTAGDRFRYGDFVATWNTNDPNYATPSFLQDYNNTVWLEIIVESVIGPNITASMTILFRNGTTTNFGGLIDVDTGDSVNLTNYFISSGLYQGDQLYTSTSPNTTINETTTRNFAGGSREVNRFDTVQTNYSEDYYWDRITGAALENSYSEVNRTGDYETTLSLFTEIVDTNVWTITPETFTWASILLTLILLVPTVTLVHRRKLSQMK